MTQVLPIADERPPMVAALSPSSIATWKQCPKRFFFEKILRLETQPGLEAVCGSFVHAVLEHLMQLPGDQRTPESARTIATERWGGFTADPETRFADLGLDDEGAKAFKRRAWAGITGYFAIEDPARVEVLATEQEVKADLEGAPLFGIVDRLERRGQELVVSDYKTGNAPKWQEEIDEKLEQLQLYAAALEASGTPVSTLRLLFVSPQLGAAARADRAAAAAGDALRILEEALPGVSEAERWAAIDSVAAAHRTARESADPDEDRTALANAAAFAAASESAGVWAPANADAAAQALLLVVGAQRRAYFARRDAERSRPREIRVDVSPGDIAAARAAVSAVWAEATACYEAWDFPARTGRLCDWCPFAPRCEGFRDWDDAGRPSRPSPDVESPARGAERLN